VILGIGTDLVDIRRIEKLIEQHGPRFLHRVFTLYEREKCDGRKDRAASFAKRFAAKEAFVKALGTGFREGISWQDMGIENDAVGKPFMWLSGNMQERMANLASGKNPRIDVSLSDDYPYAQAFVIISGS
jgi:holo-[acyl-carrier protein] synthase